MTEILLRDLSRVDFDRRVAQLDPGTTGMVEAVVDVERDDALRFNV